MLTPLEVLTSNDKTAHYGRISLLVDNLYSLQHQRIRLGNRLVAQFRLKLGINPGETEKELEKQDRNMLEALRLAYNCIADGLVDPTNPILPEAPRPSDLLTNPIEHFLVRSYLDVRRVEEEHLKYIEKALQDVPIYTKWLSGVKGVGPTMAGVILRYIDIHKATYVSSIWAFAGLDVAPDGRARSKRKEHLVPREYKDRDGKTQEKQSITFNPTLRTKLLGVLATSFLRSKSPYAEHYYRYRTRITPERPEWTKLHVHRASLRYMIKLFIRDLYIQWRALEDLPVHPSYNERLSSAQELSDAEQKISADFLNKKSPKDWTQS